MPSTVRIVSGAGGGRAVGPARRDPNIILPTGEVSILPGPLVRPDSSSIRRTIAAFISSSARSAPCAGATKGLKDGS